MTLEAKPEREQHRINESIWKGRIHGYKDQQRAVGIGCGGLDCWRRCRPCCRRERIASLRWELILSCGAVFWSSMTAFAFNVVIVALSVNMAA